MATFSADRVIAEPALNPGDEPYFEAAGQGRLLIKACKSCGQVHHYPRSMCPFCWSADVQWQDAKGTGTIYTFSVSRRGAGAPFSIAYVTLDEGPVMLTNIVDTDLDAIRIGHRVKVVFKRAEGGTAIPMFTPIADGEAS